MRPNHNNNNKQRMRPRPQNNRRGPNPLTRSYESNGPEGVRIRGNAHHVAEKYLQMARDAHTGGDPIAAENYLQHAEHYFRLIASAQAAQALAQSGRPPGEGEGDEGEDDDDFGGLNDRFASPLERQAPAPNPPQPAFAGNGAPPAPASQPPAAFDARPQGEREPYQQRDNYQQRGNFRQDRNPRQDRQNGQDLRAPREQRPREFRIFHDYAPRPEGAPQPEAEAPGLPSFITAAPRPVSAAEQPDASPDMRADAPMEAQGADAAEEADANPRGRRRRLRSPYGPLRQGADQGEGGEGPVGQD